MKLFMLLFLPALAVSQIQLQEYPNYAGTDLGVTYTPKATTFKVWAPKASQVTLRLYVAGSGGTALKEIALVKGMQGTWQTKVAKDLKNTYYTFQVMLNGKWLLETPDSYAKAVGVNGKRGMVVNLKETNPKNWTLDKGPVVKNATDMVLYESHIRDFSIDANSGITAKGKFLGVAEKGTKSAEGLSTGIDHLKELGITHIHLLPAFDFNSVDESKPELAQYNWGYDPLNYNVPEGSYASNAKDGTVSIKEFKSMVQALHSNGLGVIMDVVYNHTSGRDSSFNQFTPDYFYRQNPDGSYSDATGCGNEVASERAMVRKFIIESVCYWAKEYHVDGFRFDLMGVHDIATMNDISAALHKINPSIFIYGEGWTAGASPLDEKLRAVKKNVYQLNKIAAFSDDIRDGLHGPYDKVKETGFVGGKTGTAESVKFGIVGAVSHPQINYKAVNHSDAPWAVEPSQSINYASCHDDNTLFDRLKIANPEASESDLIKMDKLAQLTVFLSQGVPFIHSGAEMLRTKQGVANSYKSPDSINAIDWSRKSKYKAVFTYYQSLLAMRKNHPAFRMPTAKMIQEHVTFRESKDSLLIQFQISNNANGDAWKDILIVLNGDKTDKTITLPEGNWTVVANGDLVNEKGIEKVNGTISVGRISALVLYK
ncbi:type I pullulanase [Flavobacterium sp. N1994]|uniref:type I pullulanase n=1 Tax=Flavobacterium sp. N1994 TaxID=2986827 RepID=UPI002222E28E|nr:type I pullulanase [Flavobacterium sp. N1994]